MAETKPEFIADGLHLWRLFPDPAVGSLGSGAAEHHQVVRSFFGFVLVLIMIE